MRVCSRIYFFLCAIWSGAWPNLNARRLTFWNRSKKVLKNSLISCAGIVYFARFRKMFVIVRQMFAFFRQMFAKFRQMFVKVRQINTFFSKIAKVPGHIFSKRQGARAPGPRPKTKMPWARAPGPPLCSEGR